MKTESILLGNIYGNHIHSGWGGNVWSQEGNVPALQTMQGGNRQPLIVVNLNERKTK